MFDCCVARANAKELSEERASTADANQKMHAYMQAHTHT
jgi:hypothetical protein